MDITKFNIGTPVLIRTDDDIYESYISAITLSDEKFVYFKSGSIRTTLLDKLKSGSQGIGNKLDVSGGKIDGNLSVIKGMAIGKESQGDVFEVDIPMYYKGMPLLEYEIVDEW